MSSSVEDEIVRMSFDNKQFESGVATSIGSLDKLKSSLAFKNAGNGLADISKSANGINLGPMSSAIEGISSKWLAMGTVAVTAIANITNRVVDAGIKIGKSLTIDPLTAGFAEYSTNLNSIQTIIANTGAKLPAVNKTLDVLNTYSDKTIYNFSQMAQNIGRFTAAGVKMSDATDAIKGMANTAALSGATSEQLNSAMYQMSQALSTGVIRLMDWNSLANANMGGQNIQKALQSTAMAGEDAGAGMTAAIEKAGNFRDSLTDGWLTADIFNKTMKVMAGQVNEATGEYEAFSVAQLQGMGYSAEAAKELNALSKRSIDAATKVKTIGQAYDVVKESIGSGWAKVFQNIFGNFNQSKKLWTATTKYITDSIGGIFAALNKVLFKWNQNGGRDAVIGGLKQAFKDLLRFFIPIKNAFKEVFPPATGKTLLSMSQAFEKFFDLFRLNVKTMHVIREIFVGIFTVIKYGFKAIGFVFGLFGKLFSLFGGFSGGGLIDFLSEAVEYVTDLGKAFQKTALPKILAAFKQGTAIISSFVAALQPLVPVLKSVADSVADLVQQGYSIAQGILGGLLEGLNADTIKTAMIDLANNIVIWIKDALGIHSPAETMVPIGVNIVLGIGEGIKDAGPRLVEALRYTFELLAKAMSYLIVGLAYAFKDAMLNMDLESFLDILNTILTGGFLVAATNIASAFSEISGSAAGVLNEMKNSLKLMQAEVKAEIIKSIAVAVLLLAGAAYILSTLDGKKLAYSMSAIAGLMVALTVAMKILMADKSGIDLTGKQAIKKAVSMNGIALALVAFASAVLILAGAVKVIGSMDPKQFEQGLKGVGLIVAGIVAATAILSQTGGGATIFATAAALLVLSVALVLFAGTMKLYANLDWAMIIEGGGKAAAVIFGVGLAMRAFGKFAITGAIGLAIASVGLLLLAKALEKISKIDSEALGDSLVALVVVLATVALAGKVLSGGGALGLLAGAAALLGIAFALKILSKIKAEALTKAFVFIGLAFTALVIAASALTPLIPVMLAFGGAVLLVGQGIALAGLGFIAIAVALGIVAIVGPAAFEAISAGIGLLAAALGKAVGIFALSSAVLIALGAAGIIAAAGLVIVSLAVVIFSAALVVFAAAVTIASVSLLILAGAIAVLRGNVPSFDDIINGFKKLGDIKGILTDAKNKVGEFFSGLKDKFLHGVDVVKAGISGMIQGMKDKINGWKEDMTRWGGDIGTNLIDGIVDGLENAWHWVEEKINWISDHIPEWMKSKLGIESPSKVMRDQIGKNVALGVGDGISAYAPYVRTKSEDLANTSLQAMKTKFNTSNKVASQLMDLQPKITPILDLSNLANARSKIDAQLGGNRTINATVSRSKGDDIAASESSRQNGKSVDVRGGDTYHFDQHIISKDPIDHVKVYRGGKSQIALFKEVTGK